MSARRITLGPLWLQVLLAISLGIVIGKFLPETGVALKPLGDGFVKLIRMTLAPIIFGTVVVGIARTGDLRSVGRIGLKALIYFEVVSTIALLMGVAAVEVLKPGVGMHIDARTLDASAIATYAAAAPKTGVVAFVMDLIPTSIGDAFVRGNVLQLIVFAILFGVAITRAGERGRALVELLDQFLHGMFGIVRIVMYLAPLGALGAMAFTVGRYGVASLLQLAQLTVEIWLVSIVFILVVLGSIARMAGFSLFHLVRHIREEILITAGTSSSEAVLAPVMTKMEALGCDKAAVGLVMPTGFTFNADGTAIYLSMSALFIAQATDTALTVRDKVVLVLLLMLTSKGSAGVAGAGFVTLAATLAALDQIPVAGVALLLGVDRLTNAARAVTNVIGNAVATMVLARRSESRAEARNPELSPRASEASRGVTTSNSD